MNGPLTATTKAPAPPGTRASRQTPVRRFSTLRAAATLFLRKGKWLLRRLARRSSFLYSVLALLPLQKDRLTFAATELHIAFLEPVITEAHRDGNFSVRVLVAGPGIRHYFKLMYILARSRFIILASDFPNLYGVTPRKGTVVIQAWHAAGLFKKFCIDQYAPDDTQGRREAIRKHTVYTHFLTSSPRLNRAYAGAFGKGEEQALALGAANTDQFYRVRETADAARREFYRHFPQAFGKQVVLYAPTFREHEYRACKEGKALALPLPFAAKTFAARFSGRYVLAFRAHYRMKNRYAPDGPVLSVGDYPLHELLSCTDVLITDYSSILFDFVLYERPILFYAHDAGRYEQERGLYHPYESFAPGPVCRTQDELFDALENPARASRDLQAFREQYISACDGKVCAKILDFLKSCPPV